jgi:response regulator RpfG family c-di-GMP phosphodiesterase
LKKITNFIIIDDEYINNFIHSKLIKSVFKEAEVHVFMNPQDVLEHLSRYECPEAVITQTIVLLDFNMPLITGWEFLTQYESFSSKIKDNIKVFVVSSSVDANDRRLAGNNQHVVDFLEKPLSREEVLSCTLLINTWSDFSLINAGIKCF